MLQLGYVSRRFLYEKDKEVLMEEKMPAAGKRKYMEVLKEKFAAFKGNMKNTFVCFPVTQGSIWLFTLLFVLLININDSSVMDFLGRIMFFLVFYGTGSFFTEALYQKCRKLWLRIVLYIALVIPAVLFAWLVTLDYDSMFLAWEYDTIEFYLPRYIACYELVLFTLAVYFCFRKAGFSLEEYLARFFAWAVRVSILYFVLIIGVGLIMGILVELFDVDYDIFIQAQVLLFGIFYVSSLLRGVLPKTGDDGPFAEVLIKYVMTGLVISAFAIIYVYILKILIFRDMPSNSIFRILTGLFIAGLPIWTMNAFYTQHNPLLKISRLLPYLFAPLVLLQAYSIGIRIYENGITPMRYVCIMLLVFEILYITLYYFRRQSAGILFLVFAGLVFAACCVPGINMFSISYRNQKSALQKVLNAETLSELSQRELDRASGAYWYLYDDLPGSAYLEQLTDEQEQKLEEIRSERYSDYHDTYNFYHSEEITVLDVSDYRYCYPVNEYARYDTEEDVLTEYSFTYGDNKTITIPLREYLDGYLDTEKYSEESYEYFRSHREIICNDDCRLYLEYLSFNYDYVTEEYTNVSLRGYLLEK